MGKKETSIDFEIALEKTRFLCFDGKKLLKTFGLKNVYVRASITSIRWLEWSVYDSHEIKWWPKHFVEKNTAHWIRMKL